MIRLFSMSTLGLRNKWRNRPYYQNRTVSNSNATTKSVYSGTRQEQRDKQRLDNERIIAKMEFDTASKLLTVNEMLENFYFVTESGSSGVIANSKSLSVINVAIARNEYAPSKSTITYIDKRSGKEKEKSVSRFELWLRHEKRKRGTTLRGNQMADQFATFWKRLP